MWGAKRTCLGWPELMSKHLGHRDKVELAHEQLMVMVQLMIGSASVGEDKGVVTGKVLDFVQGWVESWCIRCGAHFGSQRVK